MEQNNHPEITEPLYEFPTVNLLKDHTEEKSLSRSKIVTLKEVILSSQFQDSSYDLPICLGESAESEPAGDEESMAPWEFVGRMNLLLNLK